MSTTARPSPTPADQRALLARLEGPTAHRAHPPAPCAALCTPWCHGG
ncbi:hypothetical protein [Motilibacter aurantiacus]|nr:hypothetical protein [Motilibacter aurantiacus]NHC44575.1 hypothetical protein [Motilibacter aurantiacus]